MDDDSKTHVTFDDPGAQTTYEGRRWTLEIEFYLTDEASAEEVGEAVEQALGGGPISIDHPLIEADFRRVEVNSAYQSGTKLYIDWTERTQDGRRTGKPRAVPA